MKMSKVIIVFAAIFVSATSTLGAQYRCVDLFDLQKGLVVSQKTVDLITQISRGNKIERPGSAQQNMISIQAANAIENASTSSKSLQPLQAKSLTAEQKLMQQLKIHNPDAIAIVEKVKRELELNKSKKASGLSLDRTEVLLEVLLLEPNQSESENQTLIKLQNEMIDFFNDTMDVANSTQRQAAEQQVADFIKKTRASHNLKELNLLVSKLFQLNVSSEKIVAQLLMAFAEVKKTENSESSVYSGLKNLIRTKFNDVSRLSIEFQNKFYEQFKDDVETMTLASMYMSSKWIDPINEIFKVQMIDLSDQHFSLDAAAYFLKFNIYKKEVIQTLTILKNSKDAYSETRELAEYLLQQIRQ